MKNITLSVDEAVYRAARVEAAKRNRSLSAIVRDYSRLLHRARRRWLRQRGPSARIARAWWS